MATYSANTIYEYTNQMAGSFSGGTWDASLKPIPHPTNITYKYSQTGDTVVDLNAVQIGGFNGLNN